jgi:hypothetical protein
MSLVGVPISWGSRGRPISTTSPTDVVRQIRQRMGGLYEALSRATFWPMTSGARKGGPPHASRGSRHVFKRSNPTGQGMDAFRAR